MGAPFRTSDLDAAAFLVAMQHPLRGIERGRRSTFVFDASAAQAVGAFYSGALVCAQDFGTALRELKSAIFHNPNPAITNATTEADHDRRR
jgi:hypothetical protein